MKKIAILGSTGSIGTQTLELVRDNPELQVVGLAAGTNIELLERQVREFQPKLVSLQREADCKELKIRLADLEVQIVPGMEGLLAIAEMEEAQLLVTAIVGMIGILPTIAAIKKAKILRWQIRRRWSQPVILLCRLRPKRACRFCRLTASTVRFSSRCRGRRKTASANC